MTSQPNPVIGSLLTVLSLALTANAVEQPAKLAARHFHFVYAVEITGLEPGQDVRLWLPVPPNNDQQRVHVVSQKLPGPSQQSREPKFGNDILFVEGVADREGRIAATTVYEVQRGEARDSMDSGIMDDPLAGVFLKPDARVPIEGKPLTLLTGKTLPMDQFQLGRALYDLVNTHMRYSKEGSGWGLGDAVWACDSRYGNCSDFHSLFISLARSQGVPAKFEIGFPLPAARGRGEIAGYHCWAWFKPRGHGWVPVDISEANKNPALRDYYFGSLTEDRVTFSVGRDLVLVPPQSGPPLNFFVYPYVEVDGKPYPAEHVLTKFSFEDR